MDSNKPVGNLSKINKRKIIIESEKELGDGSRQVEKSSISAENKANTQEDNNIKHKDKNVLKRAIKIVYSKLSLPIVMHWLKSLFSQHKDLKENNISEKITEIMPSETESSHKAELMKFLDKLIEFGFLVSEDKKQYDNFYSKKADFANLHLGFKNINGNFTSIITVNEIFDIFKNKGKLELKETMFTYLKNEFSNLIPALNDSLKGEGEYSINNGNLCYRDDQDPETIPLNSIDIICSNIMSGNTKEKLMDAFFYGDRKILNNFFEKRAPKLMNHTLFKLLNSDFCN